MGMKDLFVLFLNFWTKADKSSLRLVTGVLQALVFYVLANKCSKKNSVTHQGPYLYHLGLGWLKIEIINRLLKSHLTIFDCLG